MPSAKPSRKSPSVASRPALNGSVLAAGVAHELNNIAGSLTGFTELAADGGVGAPLLRACLAEIRIGCQRVTALAGTLEALAEVGGDPVQIELDECLRAAAEGGGIAFTGAFDPGKPGMRVYADARCVGRTLRTLAQSAAGEAGVQNGAAIAFQVARTVAQECCLCGLALPPGSLAIAVASRDVRPFDRQASRPRRRAGESFREMLATAAIHVAHQAGGHLQVDFDRCTVALVLSVRG